MSEAKIEPVWYVRLPDKWADVPEWMSFSRLQDIEACPRRWSLKSALYPNVWPHRVYPQKIHFATLAGQIIHNAIETITNALNRARCISVKDKCFVGVMRELGGYSKIIEETIKTICHDLQDNPRFIGKSNYISTKLRNSIPELREQLQILIGKLRLQPGFVSAAGRGPQGTRGGVRAALSNGTYSEVELRVDRLRWRGFIDTLILSDASCEIIDYKTGMPKPEHEEQLRFYSLLWARDEQLNPSGRTVDHLALAYSTVDVAVEPPTSSQLNIIEQEIISRTKTALDLVRQTLPVAVPSIHNCRYCSVRQLCDDYWTLRVQQTLSQELLAELPVANENFVDLEIDYLEQQTPLTWRGIVICCRALPANSEILIVLSESTPLLQEILSSSTRIRILDALLVNQPEDVSTLPLVHLTKMTETFIVDKATI